jgi:hypothetical protein
MTLLAPVLYCNLALGQAPPPTILTIDVANYVEYQADIYDPSKYGTEPNVTTSAGTGHLGVATILADIVAVNGQPAKGLYAGRTRVIGATPTPNPGQAIADIARTAIREQILEILQPDGTPIGTIVGLGFSGGAVPPGSPSGPGGGNWAIVGGTGAFLGARGQEEGWGGTQFAQGDRGASMAEDPAKRRLNGGGAFRFTVHVIPMSRPEIMTTSSGPAVFHADFSAVTAAKPAKAGEVLIVRATGLGPTRPGVDPGQPFPLDGLQEVNSPVDLTVNGQRAELINKLGWPGLVETYRLDFRVPDGMVPGTAAILLTAAWIAGPSVNIPVGSGM